MSTDQPIETVADVIAARLAALAAYGKAQEALDRARKAERQAERRLLLVLGRSGPVRCPGSYRYQSWTEWVDGRYAFDGEGLDVREADPDEPLPDATAVLVPGDLKNGDDR